MTHEEQVALTVAVLNDRRWTERVVTAAVMAREILAHGATTPDGDASYVSAGSLLRTALVDQDAIRRIGRP